MRASSIQFVHRGTISVKALEILSGIGRYSLRQSLSMIEQHKGRYKTVQFHFLISRISDSLSTEPNIH